MLTAVALSASVDVTYVLDALRPGEIHRPRDVVKVPGGKGLNAARAAHALGADVTAVAVVAGATGSWIAGALAADGVPAVLVEGTGETRTCVSLADAASGGLTEVYEAAPPSDETEWAALGDAEAAALRDRPGWVTLSGSLPTGASGESVRALVARARRAGARIAVDLADPALAAVLAERPDLVKVNAAEAAELLGQGPGDPGHLARSLSERAGGAVSVVTLGAAGAVAHDRGRDLAVSLDRPGRYPVGSGDSFLGGLVHGLDTGRTLADALRSAVGAGAANAHQPGAGRLDAALARQWASEAVLSP